MSRGNKILAVIGVCCSLITVDVGAASRFYEGLLERGKTAYGTGQYESAARYLEIAAFGFLESLPEYETAQIYLALANHQLGKDDDARAAIESIIRAEQIEPTYRTLALDPQIRSSFEAVIASLLPSQSIHTVAPPTTVRHQPTRSPTGGGPVDEPAVAPIPAAPELTPPPIIEAPKTDTADAGTAQPGDEPRPEQPATVVQSTATQFRENVEIADLSALLAKQPESIAITLALADAYLRAGNPDAAWDLASTVLKKEPTNSIAHTYLARIAKNRDDTLEAIRHYEAARVSGALSDEDQAGLFVCYVANGSLTAAHDIEPNLTESARRSAPVARALELLRGSAQSPARGGLNQPPTPSSKPVPPNVLTNEADRSPPAEDSVKVLSQRNPPSKEDVFVSVREARQLTSQGDCATATSIYESLLQYSDLERYVLLAVGQGLGICKAYRSTLDAYGRVEPFMTGEEEHMFREAVARYHLGDIMAAREYLKRALPHLEETPEIRQYRSLIEGTR